MSSMRVNPEYREIVRLFNKLTYSRSMLEVFNDCIEIFALVVQNTFCYGNEFQKNESRYKNIIKKYSSNEVKVILLIFKEINNQLEKKPFQDFLGDLYMQLGLGSSKHGQFFTPYALSYAMAKSQFDECKIKEKLLKQGYISLFEPAVGGGANVIAYCEVLKNHNINFQTQSVIVCQELNRLTASMCYIALSMIGCAAVIKVGDSLNNPYTNYYLERSKRAELWTTPMFHIQNCYGKV